LIKALIFDMDGLMIDSERLYFQAERDIARKFQKTVENETLWKMMGRSPHEGLAIFIQDLDLPLTVDEAIEMRTGMMQEKLRTDLESMPGLDHILGAFYGRLKLAVCTGAPQEFLNIVLDKLQIRYRFAALQDSDDIKKGKPDPEIYLKACEKLKLQPEECIVLEDSSNGVLSAKRAGCFVIAVPSDYTHGQDFRAADAIVPDLFQAEEFIQGYLSGSTGNESM
jgi:HAD superfamily hydrolase (TIGR01509 family)